jgi:hypothetical protein
LAGVGVADKEPVFLPDGGVPDCVFDEIVVEAGFSVVEVFGKRGPVTEEVIAGFAQA